MVKRQDHGIVSALNTGLEVASGAYIARMDDDDIAYQSRFETQIRFLQNQPTIGLCGSLIRFIDHNGNSDTIGQGNKRYEQWLNSLTTPNAISDACFMECALPHPSWMAPRSTFEQLNGYRQFDGPEDFDFVLRAWLAGIPMGKPNEVLLDWRVHDSRLTLNDSRYRWQAFTHVRVNAACDKRSGLALHEGRGVWICGTGKHARDWFDALLDKQCRVLGFVDIKHSGVRQQKRERPVISYEELWQRRSDELLVSAISTPGARSELIDAFNNRGWVANRDYVLGC